MSDSSSLHQVAKRSQLRDHVPLRVEAGDTPVLLIRDGETVHAYRADCPHAGAPLEHGAICHGRLVCPWHKATFDVSTGALLEPPALQGLSRYRVELRGDDVLVSTDAPTPAPAEEQTPDSGEAKRFAIVGAGAAGAAACAALRELGFRGRIVLIDHETTTPYDRTALSKFVPSGELAARDVYPLLDDDFFADQQIDQKLANVATLDARAAEIRFDNETDPLRYDAALIATGSVPKPPPVRGFDDAAVRGRVVMLRNVNDAARIEQWAAAGHRAVVIGGSFIGLEVASSLRKRGLDVTVVSPERVPFAKQFGDEIGALFMQLHRQNGTTLEMDTQVEAIEPGEPLTVRTKNGKQFACDFVVAGTGVTPATSFIAGVGRNDDGGLNVDASMRVAPNLFAAGDVACFETQGGQRIRIEHWRVAQQQSRAAARGMLGLDARQPAVPFFWTYHYGKRFDYLGHARAGDWDSCLTLGEPERYAFVTLYCRDGRVIAALGCERETAIALLAEAMREPLPADDARRIVEQADNGDAG
ncbi:FAD-dependent oxidoreductase [Paraburkholderia caballeronis]|uniref:NADPH-dependent 2,4-dienoyl-CoA reductase, sulfur reductase n=1 Tax=Paraburkholderia caballeronis TaxID=416943 RepID=A0A1H7EXP6_9BURK|nr:FAD-dependent oxidoreductase [Paraburkholderia caballeronis]PXW23849.1 NADPH-dependent 2,4-dienoyl-CoA reductase/sulfur reductase-like enzyme [Paraburkholderia caballeronis]PXW99613.1 NADPH-dependent 2,4-dienoyl-CoA reductase/sulfur reductase-like enzyme [Paraburkholderia caballeronis]RAJ96567.1 NADPH-dependent 2,4-dienoyl-CoA reductase/sulfur reductase-like enzyme [Paraburkholderia caballeronis]SEE80362.1 NADPH-dependent 2,4-dienoyl-CoA reductase, sulfur reductase [Paraburkholderia caballer